MPLDLLQLVLFLIYERWKSLLEVLVLDHYGSAVLEHNLLTHGKPLKCSPISGYVCGRQTPYCNTSTGTGPGNLGTVAVLAFTSVVRKPHVPRPPPLSLTLFPSFLASRYSQRARIIGGSTVLVMLESSAVGRQPHSKGYEAESIAGVKRGQPTSGSGAEDKGPSSKKIKM